MRGGLYSGWGSHRILPFVVSLLYYLNILAVLVPWKCLRLRSKGPYLLAFLFLPSFLASLSSAALFSF
jgi:hypothetical protein